LSRRPTVAKGALALLLLSIVFNIFNSDTALTLRNNSSQVTATTPWAQTLSMVRPRTIQFGVRISSDRGE